MGGRIRTGLGAEFPDIGEIWARCHELPRFIDPAAAFPPIADTMADSRHGRYGPMLLKKAKMNRSKFLPVRPSKPVFHTQSITEGLRRPLVENWTDYLSPYVIFGSPH